MRLDQYLSDLGIVKRRTVAKEMTDGGLVKINGNRTKPAHPVKVGDIIFVSGSHPVTLEVLDIPVGSVKKEDRVKFFRVMG